MTWRWKRRRKKGEVCAEPFRPLKFSAVMTGRSDHQARTFGRRRRLIPMRTVNPVRADFCGEFRVGADQQFNAARRANGSEPRRQARPAAHFIVSKNNGRALRQNARNEFRMRGPRRIRHKGEAEWRIGARLAFERASRRC